MYCLALLTMLLCVCGAVTNMKGERVTRYFASLPLLSDVHRARTCRQHDGRDELCDRGSGCDAVRREPAVQRVRKLPIGGKLSVYLAVDLHRLTWSCPQANYAHQQELDMIPLMMQEDYAPNGWCMSQHQKNLAASRHRCDAVDMEAFCCLL